MIRQTTAEDLDILNLIDPENMQGCVEKNYS
jgi:hypothetical protein